MKALELLDEKLTGSFIYSFQVGDSWVLALGEYFLSVQNVISKDEKMLNNWLANNYASFQNAVDKEYISKSIIVSSRMRKEITRIKLGNDYSLTIYFENDNELFIPVDEDNVDWQWCLNKTGKDPYKDYIIACFWKGKIAINEASIH